jgi:PadR family transcriptional regulator PadR
MKGTQLSEFEEIALLTVALLNAEACRVAVLEEMEKRMQWPLSIGLVHSTLQRLSPRPESALIEARKLRNESWAALQKAAFKTGF